ncbi:hypothetical protein GOARA_015_00120 [Gordonia araii NBRC 100433]|uniref:Uncharacterized protein n=1 Tax=Gordonia araii NBRC 100433 TaxID=1073574 RepID=G7GYJ9_9ACTN|nr:hypothetical protein [Gordonia araii]NNG97466.1 hypothetical protein [Gordonia araii NBRC 100433]GAB08674.1 hypothetical protein GOARA_015_00120 [Gordonia araii NBRC 100433]
MSSFNPFGPGNDPGQSPAPGQVPGQPPAGGQPGYPGGYPQQPQQPPPPEAGQPWQPGPDAHPGGHGQGRHEAPAGSPYGDHYGGEQPGGPYGDPFAGRHEAQAATAQYDPLARPGSGPSSAGVLAVSSPPNGILIAAAVCAVVGGIVGAIGWGRWWSLLGWVFAGPIAIWLISRFVAVDTARKTETVYARPASTGVLWIVAISAVVLAIAVTALAVGFWIGRL